MKIEEHIKHWLDSADNDLKAAENLFKSGNYDWCLFLGHLVLEKTLKALYVKISGNKTPPKLHNLIKLAILCDIEIKEETQLFFDKVNNYNIEARYAQYKNEFYKLATKEYTEENFTRIKEYYKWLKSLIT